MLKPLMKDIDAINAATKLRPTIAAHLRKGTSASRLYVILARALGDDLLSVAAFADRPDDRVDAVIRVAAKRWARSTTINLWC